MNPFSYTCPTDTATVFEEWSAKAQFIAGGTNLLDLMKANVAHPSHLINLNKLPLTDIADTETGGLRLGALATNANTAYHEQVQKRYPLLSQAILAGASAQLRNMATNGGNLFQRTRCSYFYDTALPCHKRQPGSGCGALTGYNRMHAILGTEAPDGQTYCIATYPSDMAVALRALDATIHLTGPNGNRTIPMADFHRLPGQNPQQDNTARPGELVVAIELPAKGFAENYTYLKIRDRSSYAFALVSVAVGLELVGNVVQAARIALGGVAHTPWRVAESEQLLENQPLTDHQIAAASERLLAGARGFGHNNFKIELAKRAIHRAIRQAANPNPQP